MKRSTKIELLALIVASATACGGDEKPTVNNSDNNTTANNTTANNTTANNTTANNTTANNTTVDPNNTTPDGAITLVSPTDETYVSGTVTLVFDVSGEVESANLLVDGTAGQALEAPYTVEFDTSGLTEDRHSIGVEYTVGGETRSVSDLLSIIVDRSAPVMLGSTPMNGGTNVDDEATVMLTFSEAIDPDSLQELTTSFGGAQGTAMLVSDYEVVVDYDRNSVAPPYDVTIDYSGLRDRAGNNATGTLAYNVPRFVVETLEEELKGIQVLEVNGVQRLVGARADALVAMERDATGAWVELDSIAFGTVHGLSAVTQGSDAYVAVIGTTTANGVTLSQLRAYSLSGAGTTFTFHGTRLLNGADPAATAPAIAKGAAKVHVGMLHAAAMDVFSLAPGEMLTEQSTDLFPVPWTNPRVEKFQLLATAADVPTAVLARCTTAECLESEIQAVTLSNPLASVATPIRTGPSGSASCDPYLGFDAYTLGAETYLLLSRRTNCRVGSPSIVDFYRAVNGTWTPVFVGTNLVAELALPDERFRAAMTASSTGGLDILIASPRSLVIAHLDGANVSHEGDMAEGLDTSGAGTLSDATLSPGPIVAAGKDSRSKLFTNQ